MGIIGREPAPRSPNVYEKEEVDTAINSKSNKNYIMNGGMQVWQRSTNITTSSPGFKAMDRVSITTANGSSLIINKTTMGNYNAYKATIDTPTDFTADADHFQVFSYMAESQDVYILNGRNVTLSFRLLTNWTGKLSVAVRNSVPNRSFTFFVDVTSGVTINVEKTILLETQTIAINNTDRGLLLSIGSLAHVTYKAPAASEDTWVDGNYISLEGATVWSGTAGNYISITKLKLEQGKIATPFALSSYAEELAKCQRYYEVIYYMGGNGGTPDLRRYTHSQNFNVTKRVNSSITHTLKETTSQGYESATDFSGTVVISSNGVRWCDAGSISIYGVSGIIYADAEF